MLRSVWSTSWNGSFSDTETKVGLSYLEDIAPDTIERFAAVCAEMPVVVVRGGRTERGSRAVAAHTGATAGAETTDAALREAGVTVTASVTEAYRVAATFATQPLPRGPRTVVFGTAGGWGVLTADAVETSELELIDLPAELLAEIDKRVPPRWSRANPVDLAGGETRDTIPELVPIIAAHPQVDAVIYLGLGIQSNTAAMEQAGRFYPDYGLERIVEYHRRQDTRFAEAADAASRATGKTRDRGHRVVCYQSGERRSRHGARYRALLPRIRGRSGRCSGTHVALRPPKPLQNLN